MGVSSGVDQKQKNVLQLFWSIYPAKSEQFQNNFHISTLKFQTFIIPEKSHLRPPKNIGHNVHDFVIKAVVWCHVSHRYVSFTD